MQTNNTNNNNNNNNKTKNVQNQNQKVEQIRRGSVMMSLPTNLAQQLQSKKTNMDDMSSIIPGFDPTSEQEPTNPKILNVSFYYYHYD